MTSCKSLLQRLRNGEKVVCAAGIESEIERRGLAWMDGSKGRQYVGILSYRDLVRQIFEDFVHCGADAVIAPTISIMGDRGRRPDPTLMEIARDVANKTQMLVGASVKPSTNEGLDEKEDSLTETIKIQVDVALANGADFILGEDFTDLQQAKLALECIKQYSRDLPVIMTLPGVSHKETGDGIPLAEAFVAVEKAGADVVGLGCGLDPITVVEALSVARRTCKCFMAALPDAYRSVTPGSDKTLCTRKDIQRFSQEAQNLGIQIIGLHDGSDPSEMREVAESLGRQTPASKFAPDLSRVCKNIVNPTPTQAKRRLHQVTQEYLKFQKSC